MKLSFYQFQNHTFLDTILISSLQYTTGANHKPRSK